MTEAPHAMPTRNHDDELLIMVGDIRGKMDLLLKASETQGTRITDLEALKNRMIGAAVGMGALAGGVAAKLATLFSAASHP
jgi:hypothetical protein